MHFWRVRCSVAVQESRKKTRRTARSVGKWFTVLYLYQSVCQSSTLLQRSEGEEQEDGNKRDEEKVKDSETPGRTDHNRTKEEIQGKE